MKEDGFNAAKAVAARVDALAIEALTYLAGEAAPKANANDLTVVFSTISTLAARVDDLEEELNNAAAVAIMLLKRIKALEAGADL